MKLTDSYVSPVCIVMEIIPEGFLCQSGLNGGFNHGGIIGGDDDEIINN